MHSTLRATARPWFPSASSYEPSPLAHAAPAKFAPQPFAASFVPASNSITGPFGASSSYFPSAPRPPFYAPESPPFYSQFFAPESPPMMADPFARPCTPPLYVHEQPLGYYNRAGFFVHTGVQYFYLPTPSPPEMRGTYAAQMPPTPPNVEWQWGVGGAGVNQDWVPHAQQMMQWGGEAEKTKKKRKKVKRGKNKGWKKQKNQAEMGEEMHRDEENVGSNGVD